MQLRPRGGYEDRVCAGMERLRAACGGEGVCADDEMDIAAAVEACEEAR
jgi:hypothetical protein